MFLEHFYHKAKLLNNNLSELIFLAQQLKKHKYCYYKHISGETFGIEFYYYLEKIYE